MSETFGLSTPSVDEYIAQYNVDKANRIERRRHAWQLANEAESYRQLAPNPANMTDMFAADIRKTNPLQDFPEFSEPERNRLLGVQDSLVETVERAVTENPELGGIGLHFFMDYDVEDLRLLAIDDSFDINLDWLLKAQLNTAIQADDRADIEAQVDRKYETAMRMNGFTLGAKTIFQGSLAAGQTQMPERDDFYDEVMNERLGRKDRNHETEIDVWRENHTEMLIQQTHADAAYETFYGPLTGSNQTIWESQGLLAPEQHVSWDQLEIMLETEGEFGSSAPGVTDQQRGDRDKRLERFRKMRKAQTRMTPEIQSALDADEQRLRQSIAADGNVEDLTGTRSTLSTVVNGGLGAFGGGMDKLIGTMGSALWLVDRTVAAPFSAVGGVLPEVISNPIHDSALWVANRIAPGAEQEEFSPYNYFSNRQQAEQEAEIEYHQQLVEDETDDEVFRRALDVGAQAQWEDMKLANTETFQEFVAMGGGDEVMGAGFFMTAFFDQPEVLKAKEQVIDAVRTQDEAFIEDIREQDFRFSHEMMDILSMWGRNGPGRLATATMLFVTDTDYWDSIVQGEFRATWDKLGEESSELDFMPSAALGIDGSVLGLITDLGLGIAFDPTVWFLGPKFLGAAKGSAAGTKVAAEFLSKSAGVRSMVDDVIDFALSPARDSHTLAMITNWLSTEARAQILAITGIVDDILPPGRVWAGRNQVKGAQEVSTDFLLRLIDDEARAATSADDLLKLADDIKKNGFQEAGEITISRSDGTILLSDGVKRALAAEAHGINRVPVRLKVTNGHPTNSLSLSGEAANAGVTERILRNADRPGSRKGIVAFEEKMADGRTLLVTQPVQGPTSVFFAYIDDVAVGGLNLKDKAIGVVQKASKKSGTTVDDGRSVAQVLMDAADEALPVGGDDLITLLSKSDSLSNQGYQFLLQEAERLGQTTGLPRVRGSVSLDDMLEGGQLKRALRPLSDDAGSVFTRPDLMLPGALLMGKIDKTAIMQIVRQDILRGARPSDGARVTMHTSLPGRVKATMANMVPNEVARFFTQANMTTNLPLHGVNATKDIITSAIKMWGRDGAAASKWVRQVMNWEVRAAKRVKAWEAKAAFLNPRLKGLERMREWTGGGLWDDLLDNPGLAGMTEAELRIAKANKKQMEGVLASEQKSLETAFKKIHKELGALPDANELAAIVKEMWEDFNRTKIMPRWADEIAKNPEMVDEALGILKWDELQKGRPKKGTDALPRQEDHFFPEIMADQAEKVGLTGAKQLERMYKMLNSIPETKMATNLPLSPLDMIAASTASGSKWIKWTHLVNVDRVRSGALAVQKAWVVDKVLRPATAMTVSGDELLRIFHKGGRWAVQRYLSDRALFLDARIQSALRAGKGESALKAFANRDAVRKGAKHGPNSERITERLRQLDEWSLKTRQWERIYYADHGLGWTDIMPEEAIYLDAAKQWTGNFMQQTGFRAFLKGEDAFREWFFGADGSQLRNATLIKKGPKGTRTGVIESVEEAYKGWQTTFDEIILKTAREDGVFVEVKTAFKQLADEIDSRGGKPLDLPDWVYEHLGPIRGTQKHVTGGGGLGKMADSFFDRFFLDPVNYRRGFVADMVAQSEKARITSLILSQDMEILTDLELANALGYKGLSGATGTGVKELLTQEGLKIGKVPQSYIDDLVQRAVIDEMDHMLYVTERGSRAGTLATAVFPFGRPYADMMGFWAREVMRRPHYRSQMVERNVLGAMDGGFGVGGAASTATKAFTRFNPRTPALISRMSATDFTIDRGYDAGLISGLKEGEQAGLFPGSESTSLSPLAFLPTGGENPLYSMIPGMGYVPMWALDRLLSLGDPVNDPLAYQTLLDNVGDIVGGAHFGNPDIGLSLVQRVLGGGTGGQAFESLMDVYAVFGGERGISQVSTLLGQPDREIDRGRYASAIMTNPDVWDQLEGLEDWDSINLIIDQLAGEADQDAALGNLSEQITRYALPANSHFSGELDTIWDVWVDAGLNTPALGGGGTFDPDNASPEDRQKYAANVRSNFFDLPQWRRDSMIASNPVLAVNLVSSWEWTDVAEDRGINGTEVAYRTGGSREELARHDLYIKTGFIRPLSPQERIRRIIGLALNARESTAKGVYESVARNINDVVYESYLGDGDLAKLEAAYSAFSDRWNELDIRSPRELWAAWGTYEGELESLIAADKGIAEVRGESTRKADLTDWDRLRRQINIDVKPWGETWVGLDPENLPKRMRELRMFSEFITDDVKEQAAAVGIEITDRMTGEQMYGAVQGTLTSMPLTLKTTVDPAYQTYVGSRTAVDRAVQENMQTIMFDLRYSEGWRGMVKDFVEFEARMSSRYREAVLGMPPSEILEVHDRFMAMMQGADDNVITDWDQLWTLGFERNYGPLDWTPPSPRLAVDEAGNDVNGAYQPYIRNLIDGDSMVVRDSVNGPWHEVRLLGVRARDYGLDDDGAAVDKDRLMDALQQAIDNGDTIRLVRDANEFGNVDIYGRELAWLWIGDTPFYFADEMLPTRDPVGQDFVSPFGGEE